MLSMALVVKIPDCSPGDIIFNLGQKNYITFCKLLFELF